LWLLYILYQLLQNGSDTGIRMARSKAFDETRALDAAIACFWARGYGATSVRDLADAMGICGPSLYNAFGDKRALFVQALERYLDGSMRARIARFATRPPLTAIRAFVADIIERSLADRERRGCMLINSALEIAPHDQELGAEIAERLKEMEAFFRRCIIAGQADGSIACERGAVDLARLMLGVVLGIRVLARVNPSRALLEGVARPALALLDPHPQRRNQQ
jgi:TetR/AcrR family transcriptional repressor of nem operon